MFYSLLLIAVIVALIWAKRSFTKLPPEERKAALMNWSLIGGAIVVVGLILAGRAPWVMGILAALMAVAGRVAQLASYFPIFKQIFGQASGAENGSSQSNGGPGVANNQDMDKRPAAEILGVAENASAEEVKLAHKRLMQKLHPDRGGSDALAKQINRAKDVLLS